MSRTRLLAFVCLALFSCARSDPKIRGDDASLRARPAPSEELPPPQDAAPDADDGNALRVEIDATDRLWVDGHLVPGEAALASAASKARFDGRDEAHIYASPKSSAPMVLKVVQVLSREGIKRVTIRSTGKGPVSLTIGGSP